MVKKQYVHPNGEIYQIKYPIDPNVDYRLPENRQYLVRAWLEANCLTTEMNQQLRLMDWALESKYSGEYLLESKLWLSFLWGCCYNLISPWVIITRYPTPPFGKEAFQEFSDWYNETFEKHRFDTDCRYRKSKMLACVDSYLSKFDGNTQLSLMDDFLKPEQDKSQELWDFLSGVKFFGRLSIWNCVEALALVTDWKFGVDAPSFMLSDVTGSESNRNGSCFSFNKEEYLTKHGIIKGTSEKITKEVCAELEQLTEEEYQFCKKEFEHITVINRLNFETAGTCCWIKKRFRDYNTRYIGWDSERTYSEIKYIEEIWGAKEFNTHLLWQARKMFLPDHLLCECNTERGYNPGVQKWKMPDFYNTGTPMDILCLQENRRWEPPRKSTAKRLW